MAGAYRLAAGERRAGWGEGQVVVGKRERVSLEREERLAVERIHLAL